MNSVATKKVIVEFPEDLLNRAQQRASELSTDRSKLIRSAVENFLNAQSRAQIERELAEGYAANADLNRRICQEFAYVDAENL